MDSDFVGICATETFLNARVLLTCDGKTILDQFVDLLPGKPFIRRLTIDDGPKMVHGQSSIVIYDSNDTELISYSPQAPRNPPLSAIASPPKLPHQIDSLEELFLTGL
jgi:hypothetical protein